MRIFSIKTVMSAAFVAAAALSLAACSDDDDTGNSSNTTPTADASGVAADGSAADGGSRAPATIADLAVKTADLSTLVTALTAADLVETLKGAGPFTVFAPTNAAFAKIPKADLDALLADKEKLKSVLLYHVVAAKVLAKDVAAGKVETVQGDSITVTVDGGTVKVDGATVTTTDIEASNGIIHLIDTVIMPPKAAEPKKDLVDLAVGTKDLSTLVAAVKAADLVDTLKGKGPFTVFAPTNAAFAKIPKADLDKLLADKEALKAVLLYHVVAAKVLAKDVAAGKVKTAQGASLTISIDGSTVKVDAAKVIKTDIEASNGVVHLIDTVIMPPKAVEPKKDLVDLAVGTKDLSTLVAAVKAAGLVDTLKGKGPFTVFAPTNAAFAKIPKADLDKLLADKEALKAVLLYHVVAAKVLAKDVAAGKVKTAQGASITISIDGNTVKVDAATVIKTDIEASNGVVHLIDTVIMPPKAMEPKKDLVDLAVGTKDLSTLVAAVKAADLVATLKSKGPFTVFAPTNAAFAKIPKADLDKLLADKAALKSVLLYHVVAAKVLAKDVAAGKVKTAQGASLTISIDGSTVKVDAAKVIKTDIEASNGVVHLIDTVIMPPKS